MDIFSQFYRLLTRSPMRNPKHDLVFLLGFMATGKSTYGKSVAQRLNWHFVDLDTEIELRAQKSIPEIFSEFGEDRFREIERQTLEEVVARYQVPTILSCGGGTPCYRDNMEWMNEKGHTLYIHTPFPILLGRLRSMRADRPMLASYSDEELPTFIKGLIQMREPFYLQAKSTIYTENMGKEAVSRHIVENIFP